MASNGQHGGTVQAMERAGAPQGQQAVQVTEHNDEQTAEDVAALEAEIDRLEAEVARREAELEAVVNRYERQLEHRDDPSDHRDRLRGGPASQLLRAARRTVADLAR